MLAPFRGPYVVFSNNPIIFSDIKGDTVNINLFSPSEKQSFHNYANNFAQNPKLNDGYFAIHSHGNPTGIQFGSLFVMNAREIIERLSEINHNFADAIIKRKPIILDLQSCHTGSEYMTYNGKEYGPYYDPIAFKLSRLLPEGSIVKAFDGFLIHYQGKLFNIANQFEDGGQLIIKGGGKQVDKKPIQEKKNPKKSSSKPEGKENSEKKSPKKVKYKPYWKYGNK